MDWVNVNGTLLKNDTALIRVDNRNYRYGEGLFETFRVVQGQMEMADLHLRRLFQGLHTLFPSVPDRFTPTGFEKEAVHLCHLNHCVDSARVRITISGGHGLLYDTDSDLFYTIECWPLSANTGEWNENGLVIDVFTRARKSCDAFANLKTASHLVYAMGARHARANGLDDCLVMNTQDRFCDTTMGNFFWINDETIYTPPLSEGCIAGVYRKYLVSFLITNGYDIREQECTEADLLNATEIFTTNVIRRVQPVRVFAGKTYSHDFTKKIVLDCVAQKKPA